MEVVMKEMLAYEYPIAIQWEIIIKFGNKSQIQWR